MSKKNTPAPDNPFLNIDKSLFAKEKHQGRDQSYAQNKDLKKAAKAAKQNPSAVSNEEGQYFSDMMNMGGVEKLQKSQRIKPSLSLLHEAQAPVQAEAVRENNPDDNSDDWPVSWKEDYFAEPEPNPVTPKLETATSSKKDKTGSLADNSFSQMGDVLAGIKLKDLPQPEPDDKGHDRKQEDVMLKEYLDSSKNRPAGPQRIPRPQKTTETENPVQAQPESTPQSEDDFCLAMLEVAPLSGKGREIIPEPAKLNSTINLSNPLQDFIDGKVEFLLEYSDEFIQGHVVGLDPATMGKLRAGSFSFEAHLDLHGFNSVQAFASLVAFIKQSYMTGKRTVLLIPGRGKNSPDGSGILRDKLQEWLTQDPFKRVVLAFCTALPKHGGSGAVYVLLRKLKKSRGKIQWDQLANDPDLFL